MLRWNLIGIKLYSAKYGSMRGESCNNDDEEDDDDF